MENYFETLRKCPLFEGIKDIKAAVSDFGGRKLTFSRQSAILAEGDRPEFIGVMLSGAAQIERVDYYGNRSIMAVLSPPELFAESFVCAGVEAMPVSVTAVTDCCVLALDHSRLTAGDSKVSRRAVYNLMRVLAAKNIFFNQRIEITSKRTTREKLLAYLAWQAKRAGSNEFTIPLNRQELADYLEVERSGLSAEIGKLRREGVIDSRRSWFKLENGD